MHKHALLYGHAQEHRTHAKLLEGSQDPLVVCGHWPPEASIVHDICDDDIEQIVEYEHVRYAVTDGFAGRAGAEQGRRFVVPGVEVAEARVDCV